MERKIGEIFEYNGEWYQCVEGNGCENCAFKGRKCYLEGGTDDLIGECCYDRRRDDKDVIFKKLEKVGEPIEYARGLCFQRYRLANSTAFYEGGIRLFFNAPTKTFVYIEIKQNKEDMEEKGQCCDNRFEIIDKAKEALLNETNIARDEQEMAVIDNILFRCWQMGWLDKYDDTKHSNFEKIGKNLKEFNLEAAKLGKPVCTRDGRKARIICFDLNNDEYPIVVAITNNGEENEIHKYSIDGKICTISTIKEYDLMMLPEKKEGWVNIYNADTTFYYVDGRVFETKDKAVQEAKEEVEKEQREKNEYIDTIRVEWEE